LIDPLDFSVEEIDEILSLSKTIAENLADYSSICAGMVMGSLFLAYGAVKNKELKNYVISEVPENLLN
jgi:hypothetical protein